MDVHPRFSALHLDSCSQKQEFDERYLGCGFPALEKQKALLKTDLNNSSEALTKSFPQYIQGKALQHFSTGLPECVIYLSRKQKGL